MRNQTYVLRNLYANFALMSRWAHNWAGIEQVRLEKRVWVKKIG
jgi:hypothetical protein